MRRSRSPSPPTGSPGEVLVALARASIAEALVGIRPATDDSHAWLHDEGACFVTLTTRGRLHGCIGSVEAYRTLLADVRGNAHAAAFRDHRFPRLTAPELEHTVISVSVLSPSEPLSVTDEADALARLRPHVDGIVLECGVRSSTFLPRVWEHVRGPEDFLQRLKLKAGLPASYWSEQVQLRRYTVTEYHEGG